jgi:hypothetical protein
MLHLLSSYITCISEDLVCLHFLFVFCIYAIMQVSIANLGEVKGLTLINCYTMHTFINSLIQNWHAQLHTKLHSVIIPNNHNISMFHIMSPSALLIYLILPKSKHIFKCFAYKQTNHNLHFNISNEHLWKKVKPNDWNLNLKLSCYMCDYVCILFGGFFFCVHNLLAVKNYSIVMLCTRSFVACYITFNYWLVLFWQVCISGTRYEYTELNWIMFLHDCLTKHWFLLHVYKSLFISSNENTLELCSQLYHCINWKVYMASGISKFVCLTYTF